jgi:hypothetical protein
MNRAVAKRLQLRSPTSQENSGHLQSFPGLRTCCLLDKQKVDAGMSGDSVRDGTTKRRCYLYFRGRGKVAPAQVCHIPSEFWSPKIIHKTKHLLSVG